MYSHVSLIDLDASIHRDIGNNNQCLINGMYIIIIIEHAARLSL